LVNDFPKGCEADPKTCTSPQIGWAFGAGPLLITLIALFTNNMIIYFHVKNKLGQNTNTNNNNNNNNLKAEGLTSEQARQLPSLQHLDRARQHERHIREVATQGFLYVVTFFCTYTPSQILRGIEAYTPLPVSESPIFTLLLLNSILLPLQGFFNMFVYNRPNYTRIRMAYPELSALWAIQMACLDPDIPRLTEASRLSSRKLLSGAGSNYRGTRVGDKPSSGRAFSSDLDVLQEASQEESLGDEEQEEESGDFGTVLAFTGTSTEDDFTSREHLNNKHDDDDDDDEKATNLRKAMSIDNDDNDEEFDLEEEYRKVFRQNNSTDSSSSPPRKIHRSCLRISHDGSIH
jgi:hypothetical protein